MQESKKISFYIHWPFCHSICGYCDFNRFKFEPKLNRNEFLHCYLRRIEHFASIIDLNLYKLESIFFGGGTPSTMYPEEVGAIIDSIMKLFLSQKIQDIEITLESNPISGSEYFFKKIKEIGVSRISIGIQSFDKNKLKFLERTHSADEGMQSINWAKSIFKYFSFDMIKDSIQDKNFFWLSDLSVAKSLWKNHVSIYSLIIEKGSKFFGKHCAGEKLCLEDEEALEMDFFTQTFMEENGFRRYEISNYCRNNEVSRHNIMYWTIQDYIGVGCGAHSRFFDINHKRVESIEKYKPKDWVKSVLNVSYSNLGSIDKSFFFKSHISLYSQILEIIMMGLRIENGISIEDIQNRMGIDVFSYIEPSILENLVKEKLLIVSNKNIKLTKKNMLLINRVSSRMADIVDKKKLKAQNLLVWNK